MIDKHSNIKGSHSASSDAEFISPPNVIKAKVGSGGLPDSVLDKAQQVLENHNIDFKPVADLYLKALLGTIEEARSASTIKDIEHCLSRMMYSTTQLKSNGAMFRYPVVTGMSTRLLRFIDAVETLDNHVIDIVQAFHDAMYAVMVSQMHGQDGEKNAKQFIAALDQACERYFNTIT